MAQVLCLKGEYMGFSLDVLAGDHRVCRIPLDGKTLFTRLCAPEDAAFFAAIPQSAIVYCGVNALPDGTFWLHWLHAPCLGTFSRLSEPRPVDTPTMVHLREFLQAVENGKTDMAVPPCSVTVFPPGGDGLADIAGGLGPKQHSAVSNLSWVEGTVEDIWTERIKAMVRMPGSPGWPVYFTRYSFFCGGRLLDWTMSEEDTEFSSTSVFMDPHPFFLAREDRIRVVFENNSGTCRAMRNLTDGSVYWLREKIIEKSRSVFLEIAIGCPLLGMASFPLISLRQTSSVSSWDLLFGMGLGLAMALYILLLLWFGLDTSRTWADADEAPYILEALGLQPDMHARKQYVQIIPRPIRHPMLD